MARGGFYFLGLMTLLISGCGQDLCIGGVGQCGYDPATVPAKGTGSPTRDGSTGAPGTNGSAGSGFTIAIVQASVNQRQQVDLKAAGYKNPITWRTTYPSANYGTIDGFKYTAPDITTTSQIVRIQATDADSKVSNEIQITVIQ